MVSNNNLERKLPHNLGSHPEMMARRRAVQRQRRVGHQPLSEKELLILNNDPESKAAKKIQNRMTAYRPVVKNSGRSRRNVYIERDRW